MAIAGPTAWGERHQVLLYLAAIALGCGIGLLIPGSVALEVGIEPVLGLLLFVTFLGVPFSRIRASLRDRRFLLVLGLLDFVVVPVVVFALSRFVAHDQALLFGVLLVLLTPCVDYVIVFTRVAGGAADRLLAAAPLLMIAQIVLLPLFLWLFAGADAVAAIDVAPFLRAFVVLIVLPLSAAVLLQGAGRRMPRARRLEQALPAAMVPLMVLTLAIVVASQAARVRGRLADLVVLVPLYAAFVVVMLGLGLLATRVARTEAASSRALVFSGVTRNSLVVLPLALALPSALSLAALAVVTQTLVELVAMVVLTRAVPRMVPARRAAPQGREV